MYKHTYDIYIYAISCNLYIDFYIFISIHKYLFEYIILTYRDILLHIHIYILIHTLHTYEYMVEEKAYL